MVVLRVTLKDRLPQLSLCLDDEKARDFHCIPLLRRGNTYCGGALPG